MRRLPTVWVSFQARVLLAVILQDMKTRFGSGYFSYMFSIAWPFSHVAAITLGYAIINQYAPVGGDPFIFVATAAIPYMLCLYPSRLVALAILVNKPFLSYPVISPHHLILARAILEFMNVTVVVVLIAAICFAMDIDFVPLDTTAAAGALSASVFLGVSFGFLFAILTSVLGPFFGVFVTVLMIALFASSFALVPDYLFSSTSREYLAYNPIFCLTKWLRAAYYPFYRLDEVPSTYVISLSAVLLFFGILGERLLRGRIIS